MANEISLLFNSLVSTVSIIKKRANPGFSIVWFKNLVASRIQIQIPGVEGKSADLYSTSKSQSLVSNCTNPIRFANNPKTGFDLTTSYGHIHNLQLRVKLSELNLYWTALV